ncbi:MAG: hypothetical protein ACRDWA_16810 [Acidimicrobiia bacterium]
MLPMIAGYVLGSRAANRASGMSVVANAMFDKGSVADVDALNERVDRLLLVVEAFWTMLKKDGHTDEELATMIAELDAQDGSADGRRSKMPTTCTSCGSKVAPGLPKCQICGHATGHEPSPLERI